MNQNILYEHLLGITLLPKIEIKSIDIILQYFWAIKL